MRATQRAGRGRPSEPEDFVSDAEVEEAIALLGGDTREAIRALIAALHRLVSRGYTRGLVVVGQAANDGTDAAVHVH
jgi:hypothetical protein